MSNPGGGHFIHSWWGALQSGALKNVLENPSGMFIPKVYKMATMVKGALANCQIQDATPKGPLKFPLKFSSIAAPLPDLYLTPWIHECHSHKIQW